MSETDADFLGNLKSFLKKSFPRFHEAFCESLSMGARQKGKRYVRKHPMDKADALFYKTYGRHIDWDDPQDLMEKINWLKFHSDPYEWARLADKYAVRDYVRSAGFEDILIPLYGAWRSVAGVMRAWDSLPDEFVLKSSNGSGRLIIVREDNGGKKVVDKKALRKTLRSWLREKDYGLLKTEFHYTLIKKNRILAEKLLLDDEKGLPTSSLIDYKIWCLNGKPYGCFAAANRTAGGDYSVDWYDLDWNRHSEYMAGTIIDFEIPRPEKWGRMLEIAEKLAQGHEEVRIDLYYVDSKVYFGEMTFTTASGFSKSYGDEILAEMGKQIQLDLNRPFNQFAGKDKRTVRKIAKR